MRDTGLNAVAAAEPEMDLLGINWTISEPTGGMLGRWVWRLGVTDRHTLDLTMEILRRFDRRLAVALGVLLDFTGRWRR